MTILPNLASLPEGATLILMLLASLALVLLPSIFVGRVRDEIVAAQEKAFLGAWNLRQLLPPEAQSSASASS
jgi:hypothetical protein